MKIPEDPLRILARSYYWQSIYHRAKELPNSISIFKNKKDFTDIQLRFLQYIELISSLYFDLSMGEDLITEEVIKDWIRAEAYMLYKKEKKNNKDTAISPPGVTPIVGQDRIVFIKRKKKDI